MSQALRAAHGAWGGGRVAFQNCQGAQCRLSSTHRSCLQVRGPSREPEAKRAGRGQTEALSEERPCPAVQESGPCPGALDTGLPAPASLSPKPETQGPS